MKSLLKFFLKTILPRAIIERLSCFMGFNDEYYKSPFANEEELGKATNYIERFREIISDPINLLIERERNDL